mgnify:CR=1 FL=1
MNWFKRTFHGKKQEVRGKKREERAVSSYFSLLTSYSKFRLVTPVFLALFTGFLIRLRRIPRIFVSYLCIAKIRGAVRYFLKRRNIEQSDSAARQRMTPMSMAKFSFPRDSKNLRDSIPEIAKRFQGTIILPYLVPRNFSPRNFRDFILEIAQRFPRTSRGNSGTTGSMIHTAAVVSATGLFAGTGTVTLLLAVIGLYKIFAFDFGLRTDGAKRRTLDSGMVRDGHGCDGMIGILSSQGDVAARADNFKSKTSQGGKNFGFGGIMRELAHGTVTSVSAIKASLGSFDLFNTFDPKVLIWKRRADVVSARASSYVSPSPTTTPSIPNGYPTYPSLSLAITILIGKCIFYSSYAPSVTLCL